MRECCCTLQIKTGNCVFFHSDLGRRLLLLVGLDLGNDAIFRFLSGFAVWPGLGSVFLYKGCSLLIARGGGFSVPCFEQHQVELRACAVRSGFGHVTLG